MPGVQKPLPVPPPAVFEAIEKGLVPVWLGEAYSERPCRCSHAAGAHPNGGPCAAKGCCKWEPCSGYNPDGRFPAYRSKPLAEVGPVIPA